MHEIGWVDFERIYGRVDYSKPGRFTRGRNLGVLIQLLKSSKAVRAVEIGTNRGATTRQLALASPNTKIFTFDICKDWMDHDSLEAWVVLDRAEVGLDCHGLPNVVSIVERPEDLPDEIRASGPYDFAFIDGDHREAFVRRDTRVVLESSLDDALIVWDDYAPSMHGVVAVLDHLDRQCPGQIVKIAATRVCFVQLRRILRQQLLEELAP